MKKTLTLLAILAMASSASAVSLTWNVASIAFGGNTLKSDSNITAYLVYLGNGGSLASSYDSDAISSLTSSAVDSVSGTNTKGTAQNTYALADVADYSTYNGDVYGVLLSYADSTSGKTYYNLSSATYTVSGVADATSSLNQFKPAASTFSYGTSSEGSSVSAGSGWVAVPEPSTAALALAGLALLLKRRKA